MDNQKAKMLGENLAHYKRMQENGTVDIIEFHTTDGQKFGIGNVAAIQLLLSVTVTEPGTPVAYSPFRRHSGTAGEKP